MSGLRDITRNGDGSRMAAISQGEMSEYENIVGGKLKLKGKALDVKSGGVKKKKKKKHEHLCNMAIHQHEEKSLSDVKNAVWSF
ncbi:hypothetical protein EJ110_NYTH33613 [Nymphaea thermarum]|nr:hypothetical protein EJ110_NYTH33613 [Nymphaea thermarum]